MQTLWKWFFVFILLASDLWASQNVEVYFSPKGNCRKEIISELLEAKVSVKLAIYSFTSRDLGNALNDLYDRGVDVQVYMDQGQAKSKYSQDDDLMANGVPVMERQKSGLMHNKFCVIDDETVITGSYNWSDAAETRNDENVVIIHDVETAQKFSDRFDRLWENSKKKVYSSRYDIHDLN